jgi:hypothetical protein
MKVGQCQFIHRHPEAREATLWQTAWVDASWKLKKGMGVTFLGDDRRWQVMSVGTIVMEVAEINNSWQVGGNTEISARKEKKKK